MANLALTVAAFATFLAIVTSFATSWLDGTSVVAEGFRVARVADGVSRRTALSEAPGCVNASGGSTSFVIVNGGQTPIRNFAQWTLAARYLAATSTVVKSLTHTTSGAPSGDQWTVGEIRMKNGSPEVFGPGVIDPGEEATILVQFSPALWASPANSVTLTTDTGSVASIDFTGTDGCGYYLHNNPTPPTGNTNQQADLPADRTFPGQAILYNYDEDRDSAAGRYVSKGGSGAAESDLTKYQNWRTAPLDTDLKLAGRVNVRIWGAVNGFDTTKAGAVTLYLRDYDGASYTEITNVALSFAPWDAAGSGTWVARAFYFPAVTYTVPAGNRLELKLIVDSTSGDDMIFAYDTSSYAALMEIPKVVTLNFHTEDRPVADARYEEVRLTTHEAGYYLHNNPTPPIANTNAQANLAATLVYPSATSTWNYDQDQDTVVGRRITRGGSGPSEADLPEYQNWRLPAAGADTTIKGNVRLDFWSMVGNFSTSLAGQVTVYLRDYNGASYTEIASATLSATPWDATGSGAWVRRFVDIENVDYTLLRGRQLEVKLIVDNGAGADMHFMYDTPVYSSVVVLPGSPLEPYPAGPAATEVVIPGAGTGRFPLPTNSGKFVLPLADYAGISEAIWTLRYRVRRDLYGFTWFTNAPDITPVVLGSWVDIDLSAYVPVGTTGAVVQIVNEHNANGYNGVIRGKADTRDYVTLYGERIESRNHRWQMVRVDPDRRIQGWDQNSSVKFKLQGYTKGTDPGYWDLPPDITPGTAGSWQTVDVSGYVDEDATGVILMLDNPDNAERVISVREVGSSFSATNRNISNYGLTMFLVGLNADKEFDAWLEQTSARIFLVAQTRKSVSFYVDDIAVADPPTGSWQPRDADTYAVPDEANGVVLYAHNSDNSRRSISFRHGDSTDNWSNKDLWPRGHFQAAVGLNAANEWDEYMQTTNTDVSIAGYTVRCDPLDADVHADVDILVRKANGEVRARLAADAANSAIIPAPYWVTLTSTVSIPEYVVVDPTDYLEIDMFAHVTRNDVACAATAYFRIDDIALEPADRTTVTEVALYEKSPRPERYGFTWFTNAPDITPGSAGSWVDIDLSSQVPPGAMGAIVQLVNVSGNDRNAIVRGTADTRDYQALYTERLQSGTHRWQIVKVDANRRIQGYDSNLTDVRFKLQGYTSGTDPRYLDVPPDITPASGSWQTVDVSGYVDEDATGVILLLDNADDNFRAISIREVGSSFSATNRDISNYGNTMFLVGLSADRKFEAWLAVASARIFLVAQTKKSVSFYVNDIAVADPSLGSWQPLDADTYSVPGEANGVILYAYNGDGGKREISFRHGDSTDNWARKDLSNLGHFHAAVGLNAANEWDEYMQDSDTDVSVAGYTVRADP